MPNVAFLPASTPVHPLAKRALPAHGAFWSHQLALGTSILLATLDEVDAGAPAIGELPRCSGPTRPMVGQYLFMVRTLAAAWTGHSRPALLSACAALRHYGATFSGQDAGALAQASSTSAAARTVDGLARRLAAPLDGLATLQRDFGSYLAQMAGASADLETDTVLVTQRLQADHVHAFILSQHVHTLQDKLAEARARRHGCWLLGAEADSARRDVAAHASALADVGRQLDGLRASQAATMAEAAWLQALLPDVASYLGGIDRIGAGIHALLSGAQLLQENLVRLQRDLATGASGCVAALDELHASTPAWRDLAARLAQLPAAPAP